MLIELLVMVMGGPALPCSIDGQVKLLKKGAAVSPAELVVVYVDESLPKLPTPVPKAEHAVIRQIDKQFSPRVKVVMMNETIDFVNEDKELHSVFSNTEIDTFDLKASKKGNTGPHTFLNSGPVMIQCDRHGWMRTDV